MKRQLSILFSVVLAAANAPAGDTNLPAPSTLTVMVDTNGVVVSPTNFVDANELLTQGDLDDYSPTNLALEVAALWVSTSNNTDEIAERAGNLTSFGDGIYTVVGDWDFRTGEYAADFDYEFGATWVTNRGVSLEWQVGTSVVFPGAATNQQLLWGTTPTSYIYRVTFWQVSRGENLGTHYFLPDGNAYGFSTAIAGLTSQVSVVFFGSYGSWAITNLGHTIGWVLSSYYSPLYIERITIEEANLPLASGLISDGDFLPDQDDLFSLGTAAKRWLGTYLKDVLEPRATIVTNADVTLHTPRWVGDELVDVGSNKSYRSYGSTTNDWGD